MKKYILFLCLFGCSADISSEPMEEKYGTYPELPEPKLMEPYKPYKPEESICEINKKYEVWGKTIPGLTWCDPLFWIPKNPGYPSPEK